MAQSARKFSVGDPESNETLIVTVETVEVERDPLDSVLPTESLEFKFVGDLLALNEAGWEVTEVGFQTTGEMSTEVNEAEFKLVVNELIANTDFVDPVMLSAEMYPGPLSEEGIAELWMEFTDVVSLPKFTEVIFFLQFYSDVDLMEMGLTRRMVRSGERTQAAVDSIIDTWWHMYQQGVEDTK